MKTGLFSKWIIAIILLGGNSFAQQNQYLNFYPWVNGATSATMTSDADAAQFGAKTGCITGDVSTALSGGAWSSGYPRWTNGAPATWGSSFGFEMNVDWTTTSQTATMTIDFRRNGNLIELPIEFFLADVNASACASTAANRFIDVVTIVGYKANLSTIVYPNVTATCSGNSVGGPNNNVVFGNPNCGSNAQGASVVFTPSKLIARLVITYSSGTGTPVNLAPCAPFPLNAGENPKSQYIRVSSIKLNYDCNTNIVLPAGLTSFEATCNDEEQTTLNWQTEREQNNDHFTVEKSVDGETYETIAQVPGSYNSDSPRSYSVTDPTSSPGIAYYRLWQTDTDGTRRFLKEISVTCNNSDVFTIIPNPISAASKLFFNTERNELVRADLYSVDGELLWSKQVEFSPQIHEATLETGQLSSGSYILQLTTEKGERQRLRLLKL